MSRDRLPQFNSGLYDFLMLLKSVASWSSKFTEAMYAGRSFLTDANAACSRMGSLTSKATTLEPVKCFFNILRNVLVACICNLNQEMRLYWLPAQQNLAHLFCKMLGSSLLGSRFYRVLQSGSQRWTMIFLKIRHCIPIPHEMIAFRQTN